MSFEPGVLRECERIAPVETMMGSKIDVLDRGVGEAKLGCRNAFGHALVGPKPYPAPAVTIAPRRIAASPCPYRRQHPI